MLYVAYGARVDRKHKLFNILEEDPAKFYKALARYIDATKPAIVIIRLVKTPKDKEKGEEGLSE